MADIFTNMPEYGPNGKIFEALSTKIKFGNRLVQITRLEIPLPGSDVIELKNYWNGSPNEVENEYGTCFNFEFRVNCTNCPYSQGGLMIQVMSRDLEFMENFLGGE